MAYCLNIPIYTISYLELSALDNKGKNTFAVKENNGYYKATFMDDKMISSISYVKSKELLENEVIVDNINYKKTNRTLINKGISKNILIGCTSL